MVAQRSLHDAACAGGMTNYAATIEIAQHSLARAASRTLLQIEDEAGWSPPRCSPSACRCAADSNPAFGLAWFGAAACIQLRLLCNIGGTLLHVEGGLEGAGTAISTTSSRNRSARMSSFSPRSAMRVAME